jgi:hypothetical protein
MTESRSGEAPGHNSDFHLPLDDLFPIVFNS